MRYLRESVNNFYNSLHNSNKDKAVYEHSFEYNRINNSDYSYVQDRRGRELIHDEARIAEKDSK